ncbi:MAG: hypothetical protein U0271_22035 [Polyangiaceae bacterium]
MGSRKQHYIFAYRYLPGTLLRTRAAQRWMDIFAGPDAVAFLRKLWDDEGQKLPAEERLPSGGVDVETRRTPGGLRLVLLRFPPPEAEPEAYCAIVAQDLSTAEILRYWTFERSVRGVFVGEILPSAGRRNLGLVIEGTVGAVPDSAPFFEKAIALAGELVDPPALRVRVQRELDAARALEPSAAGPHLDSVIGPLAELHAWRDLADVLHLQSASQTGHARAITLAQAFWLTMHPSASTDMALRVAADLVSDMPQDHPLFGLLAAACVHKSHVHGAQEKDDSSKARSFELMLRAAGPGIAGDRARFMEWTNARGLTNPSQFMGALYDSLIEFVPEKDWRFAYHAVTGFLV